MRRGLVIGKFMPLHAGHIALIRFAAERCDELIVSMSYTSDDPIPFEKRFGWLQQTFYGNAKIVLKIIQDNFDDPSLSLESRTRIWAEVIARVYPKIDFVFSSELYGEPFARHLQATHISFDPMRRQFPISASAVRSKPMTHWEFIPEAVRPYFVKKICFFGAESTGKSTMAQRMAEKYNTIFVPEVAREMITTNDFTLADIIAIGKAHLDRITQATQRANKILFCDTDAITTQIYSQHYLHDIPPILFEIEKQLKYDHYFLFDIDVPWVADGLRDLGGQRERMHELFRSALVHRKIAFTEVRGDWEQRASIISAAVDEMLQDR